VAKEESGESPGKFRMGRIIGRRPIDAENGSKITKITLRKNSARCRVAKETLLKIPFLDQQR